MTFIAALKPHVVLVLNFEKSNVYVQLYSTDVARIDKKNRSASTQPESRGWWQCTVMAAVISVIKCVLTAVLHTLQVIPGVAGECGSPPPDGGGGAGAGNGWP